MSFDDWYDEYKQSDEYQDASEHEDIEAAYNAGLARAAEIAETPIGFCSGSCVKILTDAIRKEINTSTP